MADDTLTEVELAGATLHDGTRLQLLASETEFVLPFDVQRYRWDGTVKDGGVRVFRAVG
jgi:hypothetical protein